MRLKGLIREVPFFKFTQKSSDRPANATISPKNKYFKGAILLFLVASVVKLSGSSFALTLLLARRYFLPRTGIDPYVEKAICASSLGSYRVDVPQGVLYRVDSINVYGEFNSLGQNKKPQEIISLSHTSLSNLKGQAILKIEDSDSLINGCNRPINSEQEVMCCKQTLLGKKDIELYKIESFYCDELNRTLLFFDTYGVEVDVKKDRRLPWSYWEESIPCVYNLIDSKNNKTQERIPYRFTHDFGPKNLNELYDNHQRKKIDWGNNQNSLTYPARKWFIYFKNTK